MKKVFIVLGALIIVGIIVILFVFKKQSTNTLSPEGTGTFFPLGEEVDPLNPGTIDSPSTSQPTGTTDSTGRIKRVTSRPIAGYTLFSKERTITTESLDPKQKPVTETIVEHFIRYVSRANGFVYEIKDGSVPLQISNIYVPNIYEAYFADANKTAVLRFLKGDEKTIATYSVPIPEPNPDNTRTQKEGTYLPNSIVGVAVSSDQTQLARLTVEQLNGVITISNSIGGARREVIRTPLKEWVLHWPNKNTLYLQTKASESAEGFLYTIDQSAKRLRRVLGNIRGLTTSVSPNGTYIIYSESTQNGFSSRLLNTKTGAVKNLALSILPEKCVWLKDEQAICAGSEGVIPGVYPDSWYAGVTSFSDKLYRINTGTYTIDTIYEANDSFDMTQLQVNEVKGLLYFVDKQTGTLWQVTL